MDKSSKTVWIVDDNESILEVTEIVLQEAGYTVETMDNVEVLKTKLNTQMPDIILMDILMSGVDGRDVAKELKRNDNTQSIPIIMMSADTQIEKKMQEAEADGYIKKPFDIEELENIVSKHIKKSKTKPVPTS